MVVSIHKQGAEQAKVSKCLVAPMNNPAETKRSLREKRVPPVKEERNPTRVAVIGSGVSGLAVAKYLLAEKDKGTTTNHFSVTIFERHSEVAGIWNLTSNATDKFLTPMYRGLETNVPRTLMTYSDLAYPKEVSLFPTRDKIKQYLETYAEELNDLIRLNCEITEVVKVTKRQQKKWKVKVAGQPEEYFDAVVTATGTFSKFCMPSSLAWTAWSKAHPGSLYHSAVFKNPEFENAERFQDKKVLIIGGGPSYWDIAKRIHKFVKGDILVATTKPLLQYSTANQRHVSRPIAMDHKNRSVSFGNNVIEYDIDVIILCTGYVYDFPFLPKVQLSEVSGMVCDLWQHMFWIPDPTLAFVGLAKMNAVFLTAEAQSAYVARALAGRLLVPSKRDMEQETLQDFEAFTNTFQTKDEKATASKKFNDFNYPRDRSYINNLVEECRKVDREGCLGKAPPRYDEYMIWTRTNLRLIRDAFDGKGEKRHRYATPKSLGFRGAPKPEIESLL